MASYVPFADYYDDLMENAEYEKRCDYILSLLKKYNHNTGLTLDLACGTGSLTLLLAEKGVDVYGVDASQEMLSIAQAKAYENGKNILFLCQKMQRLDLFGTIDTCVCTLDSINHITDIDDVQKTFDRVSLFLNKGGYFLFDVNTVYKHQKILADNTFVYENKKVFCVWQNTLMEDNMVKIDLDFFENANGNVYKRRNECFFERAYEHSKIIAMLEKSGLQLVDCFGDMTENKPEPQEQRAIYIAKKF